MSRPWNLETGVKGDKIEIPEDKGAVVICTNCGDIAIALEVEGEIKIKRANIEMLDALPKDIMLKIMEVAIPIAVAWMRKGRPSDKKNENN